MDLQKVSVLSLLTPFAPHVDDECEWISNVDWASHSVSCRPVPGTDFHVTLRRRQREVDGIRSVDPRN